MVLPDIKLMELRRFGKLVGTINLANTPLIGTKVVLLFAPSLLKQIYGKRYETIEVPIGYLVISDTGVDILTRRYLDVSRKSERQIKLIKSWNRPYKECDV